MKKQLLEQIYALAEARADADKIGMLADIEKSLIDMAIVPSEPTEEMLNAGLRERAFIAKDMLNGKAYSSDEMAIAQYRAMLGAV